MHGFIFIEFEKFALSKLNYKKWYEIMAKNQLEERQYSPIQIYPDKELVGLLHSVADETQTPPTELLELFGYSMVPDLLKVYRAYIDPAWDTLDMLEHAEKTIHVAVRKSTTGAAPPILEVKRVSPNEVEIHYISNRKMVELGVGLVRGIAQSYGEADNIKVELQKFEEEGRSIILVRKFF